VRRIGAPDRSAASRRYVELLRRLKHLPLVFYPEVSGRDAGAPDRSAASRRYVELLRRLKHLPLVFYPEVSGRDAASRRGPRPLPKSVRYEG
jgi:ABC-type molybdate transport system permease subunit